MYISDDMSRQMEDVSVVRTLHKILERHKSEIEHMATGFRSADAETIARLEENLTQKHDQMLRQLSVVDAPEKRAKSMIRDIEDHLMRLKKYVGGDGKKYVGGDGKKYVGGQEEGGHSFSIKPAEVAALQKVLSQLQDVAEEVGNQINKDPSCIPQHFSEDVEALIRQNVVLKREAEKNSLELMQYKDEVVRLRKESIKNKSVYKEQLNRLKELSRQRNGLSEQVRHSISATEKDEYAKEIQNLCRAKRDLTEKWVRLQDVIDQKSDHIRSMATEIEEMKKIHVVQEDEFKEHLGRLLKDKKSLTRMNAQANRQLVKRTLLDRKVAMSRIDGDAGEDDDGGEESIMAPPAPVTGGFGALDKQDVPKGPTEFKTWLEEYEGFSRSRTAEWGLAPGTKVSSDLHNEI